MKKALLVCGLLALAGCSTAQVAKVTVAGQLFCAINTADGPIVAGLIQAAAPLAGASAPAVILATGATEAFVKAACAAAGGIPVSPPTDPATAPQVAVVPPAS